MAQGLRCYRQFLRSQVRRRQSSGGCRTLIRIVMRARRHFLLLLLISPALLLAKSSIGAPQQKPVTRTFVAGSEEHYQVSATIRVETHGVSTENIGEKTYAKPFTHTAEGSVSWRATR